jgi:hypothetical protein
MHDCKRFCAVLCTERASPPHRLPGLAAGAGTSADGWMPCPSQACGDVLLAMPQGISIADVSVIHPNSFNTLPGAAATAGAAASHRDRQKRTAYARVEPNGYSFVPFSVESYRRLGHLAMKLLHSLGDEAVGPGRVLRASLVAGALRASALDLFWGTPCYIVHKVARALRALLWGCHVPRLV